MTKHVNSHHAFVIKLFCNGKECLVVVDENIPMEKNTLKYMNIANGKEIWPILVEKAWVKQIGDYPKARGLSPEDCFEEITGIPAYSFLIKDHSQTTFKSLLKSCLDN